MTARARRGSTAPADADAAWAAVARRAVGPRRLRRASTPNSRSCSAAAPDGEIGQLGLRRATATTAASSTAPSVPAGAGARAARSAEARGARPAHRRGARLCRRADARIFRRRRAGRCSTRWRRASTIAATGRSRARVTSQFENHIRAICGLPLGATDARRAAGRDAQSDRRRGGRLGRRSSPIPPRTSTSTARARPARAARWATSPGCCG